MNEIKRHLENTVLGFQKSGEYSYPVLRILVEFEDKTQDIVYQVDRYTEHKKERGMVRFFELSPKTNIPKNAHILIL